MFRALFLTTALASLALPAAAQDTAAPAGTTPEAAAPMPMNAEGSAATAAAAGETDSADPPPATPLNPEDTPTTGDAAAAAQDGDDPAASGASDDADPLAPMAGETSDEDAGDTGAEDSGTEGSVEAVTPLNPADEDALGGEGEAEAGVRVGIRPDIAEVTYTTPQGETVTVSRDQTPGKKLEGDWALIGHDCPPFCIQPMQPAPGVTTIGEVELLEMMQGGDTTLVDGRTPDWYMGGTIPGAINIPYTQAIERLAELNCEPLFEGDFDCTDAGKVILFCNGIWCGQSPTAIRNMLDAGYPADRIHYYRGGMVAWRLLGLTVAGGAEPAPVDPIAAKDVTPAEASVPGEAQESAAQDDLPQNAGQDVPEVLDTPAENPVVEETTEEATETGEAPIEGEPTAATPEEAESAN